MLACSVALSACSSDPTDEDAEVAGAVLERDDDSLPAPVRDPDDPRVDPRTEPPQDPPADENLDDPADGDDTGAPGAADGSDAVPSDPPSAPPAGPGSSPAPRSDQPAAPAPRRLPAGPGGQGVALGFGDDGAETSSQVLDREPSMLVADAVRDPDRDRVSCVTRLRAPRDRGVIAKGTLRVGLVLDLRDGTAKRVPRQLIDLDVHLAAGEEQQLPASRGYAFTRDTLWGIACEAVFEPDPDSR